MYPYGLWPWPTRETDLAPEVTVELLPMGQCLVGLCVDHLRVRGWLGPRCSSGAASGVQGRWALGLAMEASSSGPV
jgi:hypothetical protein